MLIKVRVHANARKETLIEVDTGRLQLSVKDKAQDGAANARVIELVARHYHVDPRRLRIVRGRTQPSKTLELQ